MEAALRRMETATAVLAFVLAPPEIAVGFACAVRLCLAAREFMRLDPAVGAVTP